MIWFWLGLSLLFISFGLFVLTQTTQNVIGIPIILIGIVIILVVSIPAHGRDLDGRFAQSPLKSWFDKLQSKKGPCCSDADGSALSDVDWEVKDGKYRVRLEDKWWDVPDEAVITEPNRAGRTMVWPIFYRSQGALDRIDIRCFIPGSMT